MFMSTNFTPDVQYFVAACKQIQYSYCSGAPATNTAITFVFCFNRRVFFQRLGHVKLGQS